MLKLCKMWFNTTKFIFSCFFYLFVFLFNEVKKYHTQENVPYISHVLWSNIYITHVYLINHAWFSTHVNMSSQAHGKRVYKSVYYTQMCGICYFFHTLHMCYTCVLFRKCISNVILSHEINVLRKTWPLYMPVIDLYFACSNEYMCNWIDKITEARYSLFKLFWK